MFRLGFRSKWLFPLLSTMRVSVGHASKFCKAAFYKITHSTDTYPHVIFKSDKNRCHVWTASRLPALGVGSKCCWTNATDSREFVIRQNNKPRPKSTFSRNSTLRQHALG